MEKSIYGSLAEIVATSECATRNEELDRSNVIELKKGAKCMQSNSLSQAV